MEKNVKNKVFIIHIISFFFIVIIGSLLHFIYDWTGHNPIMALFSAVNESVWEHLKLGFWSFILFSIIDFRLLKDKVHNYFFAKGVGILCMQAFIVVFFYTYTFILKDHNLFFNIASYIIGALLYHILSYILMIGKSRGMIFKITGIGLLLIQALCLMVFTYFTPQLPLFRDGRTGEYGIEWDKPGPGH